MVVEVVMEEVEVEEVVAVVVEEVVVHREVVEETEAANGAGSRAATLAVVRYVHTPSQSYFT